MALNWSDEGLRARMRQGWVGGLRAGTPCGSGSTPDATLSIRQQLPDLARRYGITRLCDAGAGDLSWIRGVDWSLDYRAFDLVPRHPSVTSLDITRQVLPECDAILCRHVLIHLDPLRIRAAISLFRCSARYLIASQYDDAPAFDASKQYNPTDLRPWLNEPLERLEDFGGTSDLALWVL